MPKPTKPARFLLQSLGIMLLVGAIVIAIGDTPAIGLAILSGFAGVIFLVLGGWADR